MTTFSKTILNWYRNNKRSLPWRDTRDPYKIWLSEIILQQTRVSQGLPYYKKFIEQYPNVAMLAAAEEEEILKLWQGLGYYSRARNLHAAAKTIVEEYNGNFPETYAGLLKLKGVGDYTASAIASICYGAPTPVVDGNVYRVLARYFGVEFPINSTEGTRYFKSLAEEVMDTASISDYNQGIMEFGALQCVPKSPDCRACPFSHSCAALEKEMVEVLPVKLKKNKVRIRHFNYLVYIDKNGKTILNKRVGKGIWQHLYEFPLVETDTLLEPNEVYNVVPQKKDSKEEIVLWKSKPVVHKLSHQHLITRFWIIETKDEFTNGIALDQLGDYPVPVLLSEFLDTFKNSYF